MSQVSSDGSQGEAAAGPALRRIAPGEATATPPRHRWWRRFVGGHRGPLFALTAVHLVVFARTMFAIAKSGLYYARWDFDASYHRFLVFISDSLRAGAFPLWNPYNAAGSPFFVNPQSQMWSPITLLIAPTIGYTHDLAQRQLFLTVLLGGVGAYVLSNDVWRSRAAALVTGLAYDLTAAVFSHLEHMDIVNAFALFPWLFWVVRRAAHGSTLAWPALAFFLYWFVAWGYPGVVAMTLLWLAAWYAYLTFTQFPSARARLGFLGRGAITALVAAGVAAAHWVPVLLYRKTFGRGEPIDIDQALEASLTFTHLWGVIFNFMAWHPIEGSILDRPLSGLYFGVVAIPLVVAALVLERDRIVRVLAVFCGVTLLMSMGSWSFLRVALHWLVPAFNFSRFPAGDSRTLMVLGVTVLAGGGARLLERGDPTARTLTTRASGWLLLVLAAGMASLRLFAYRGMNDHEYTLWVVNGTTAEMLLLVGIILLVRRVPSGGKLIALFSVLLAVDLGTNALINYEFIGARIRPPERRARAAEYNRRFDPVLADAPRIVSGKGPGDPQDSASMVGLTSKRFYLNDYGGFRLRRFDHLLSAGFTDWLVAGKRVVALPPDASPSQFQAFADVMRPVEYRITNYEPNRVAYEVRSDGDSLLVFNEVYFPGWRAWVDGVPRPVVEVAGGLRGVQVGPGAHDVVMRFQPRAFYLAVAISTVFAVLLAAWFAIVVVRARRSAREDRAPAH